MAKSEQNRTEQKRVQVTIRCDADVARLFADRCEDFGLIKERVHEALMAYMAALDGEQLAAVISAARQVKTGLPPASAFGEAFYGRLLRAAGLQADQEVQQD